MKNIERWLKNGLIDENLAQILCADLKKEAERKQKLTMQVVLYTIGVILLGTGVITFVAGNDWLLKLLKSVPVLQILILFICAAASLLGGWKLGYETKKFPRLGNALIFLSTLLIGACYIQIGQTYNWSTNTAEILLLWFLSIFPLAFLFKSKSINWLSIILFVTAFPYFYYEWRYDTAEVWTIFMPFSFSCDLKLLQHDYGNRSQLRYHLYDVLRSQQLQNFHRSFRSHRQNHVSMKQTYHMSLCRQLLILFPLINIHLLCLAMSYEY